MGKLRAVLATTLLGSAISANAAPVWVGSADYNQLAGGDHDLVSLFDTYDFGTGLAVTYGVGSAAVGDVIETDFQSYTTGHELNSQGGGVVAAPNLETMGANGSGNGYELTVVANYTQEVTSVAGGMLTSSVTGGTASIIFDTTPDFDFTNDTGFDDGIVILEGNIIGGGALFLAGAGFGSGSFDIEITNFDANVFAPGTLTAGNAVFTLQVTNEATEALINSVLAGANSINGGQSIDPTDDLVVGADGNFSFTAVPIPGAVWLFFSAIVGVAGWRSRRQ